MSTLKPSNREQKRALLATSSLALTVHLCLRNDKERENHMSKVLSLDIETDTSPLTEQEKAEGYTARGLDPHITEITSVAVAYDGHTAVFDDSSEQEILEATQSVITMVNPSVLVTWNGSVFDLPFIDFRSRLHGVNTSLKLVHNPQIVPKYDPTPGYEGGYSATWGNAVHIDVAYLVKDEAERQGVKWSLKPYAQSIGLDPVEVDRTKMHDLTPAQLREYVASDAIVTLEIARRKLYLV